jgi:hypothetical protein
MMDFDLTLLNRDKQGETENKRTIRKLHTCLSFSDSQVVISIFQFARTVAIAA